METEDLSNSNLVILYTAFRKFPFMKGFKLLQTTEIGPCIDGSMNKMYVSYKDIKSKEDYAYWLMVEARTYGHVTITSKDSEIWKQLLSEKYVKYIEEK